jgi:two-component system, NarL family, sensor histidine kinase EvgS
LAIDSTLNVGTTARLEIELPLAGQYVHPNSIATSFMSLQHENADVAGVPVYPPVHRERQTILVAEDHPVNRELLRLQLTRLGWTCDTVNDGTEALAAIARHTYGLLITDCHMPNMNGDQLALMIRAHEQAVKSQRPLPIIAVTASILNEEKEQASAAGINDYLLKPIRLSMLAACLEKWLPGSPDDAAESQTLSQGAAQPPLPVLQAAPALDSDSAKILIAAFTAMHQDDPVQVHALTTLFVDTLRKDLIKLQALFSQPTSVALQKWIHRQAGAFAVLDCAPLLARLDRFRQATHQAATEHLQNEIACFADYLETLAQQLEQYVQDNTPGR